MTADAQDPHAAPHGRPLTGALFWVAIAFSSYQIWMASFHPLSSQVIRAIHVGFVLLMIFALYPPFGQREGALRTAGKSHVTTRTWTGVQRAQIAAAVIAG